jgi:hypothetical protein
VWRQLYPNLLKLLTSCTTYLPTCLMECEHCFGAGCVMVHQQLCDCKAPVAAVPTSCGHPAPVVAAQRHYP